ncbi:MAG: alpha/beta hydrolase [Rhodospirillaceae bacterium]|jgi:non-heme chloroperoxidase|nr:alpha/beta hydrolase [Rhodospirillaceae bacterium]MBT5192971.1 alpha/beta hydrolase [Rhodospirillaceae bacterium]MBT5895898.1 alpha/beta hydrolase [Rhodospirillaceae bacterium]MBT6430973.1 alpha/beta hydrolase [Rhodospirillaceae bacterium]
MRKEHNVKGGSGANIWAGEWGNPDGPAILLIHGFMQSHMSWQAQYESELADEFRLVAIDNRGHGRSDKPSDPAAYQDGVNWADDVAAVIKQLELDKPVLAGWSYGGLIMLDYCQRHGCGDIAGINFVAAAVRKISDDKFGPPTIPEARQNLLSEDLPARISGTRAFLRACTAKPVDQDTFETWLAFNMEVPAHARLAMFNRELDFDGVMAELSVPSLLTYCSDDALVVPAMGDYAKAHITDAEMSIYEGIGHAPFFEDSARFNSELAAFVRRCG